MADAGNRLPPREAGHGRLAEAVSSGATLVVSKVTFDKQPSGETFVDVATSRTVTYRVMTLPNPARLVVDIEDACNASVQKSFPVDTAVLKDLRIGQFRAKDPSVVRVVADLNGNPAFDVHSTPSGIRIELRPRGMHASVNAAPTMNSAPVASPTPAPRVKAAPGRPQAAEVVTPAPVKVAKVDLPTPTPAAIDRTTVKLVSVNLQEPAPIMSAVQSPRPTPAVSNPAATPGAFNPKPIQFVIAKSAAPAPTPLAINPKPVQVAVSASAKPGPTAEAINPKPVQVALSASAQPVPTPQAIDPKPVQIAITKSAAPAPTAEVASLKPVEVPHVQAENLDGVKPEVQSTLPVLMSSTPALAAPLPPPASVTPEALRADHAALTLNSVKDDGAQAGLPGGSIGPAPDARPMYTGEPISLNLKDVDLKDFFRLIHEISGLNIILDPNVSGGVTLVLDSVPWDQALDIVLKNNRLGKVLEGNVLRIARIETLTAEQEGQIKLAAARMDAAPLVTVFRPINYAKASDIAALLKTWSGGGALTRRGTVLVDTRGNTLIISDVQAQIPVIENIVSKIDKKAKQVSIEARVVLATADFTRTLSSSLLGGFQNRSTVTTGTTGSNSTITIPVPTSTQPIPITTATSATASGFGVASIVNVGANYFINAAISAAEERDQAKTISRPSIVTQNNVQGKVMQGVQVPIQTSVNNTIAVQYEDATLDLTVTPQVTDDNNIFLIIAVNNASVGAVVSGAGPSINTQQATTSVLVPDGGTVVFGGITVTGRSKSATYIPVLGNIPLLGHLFKTSNQSDQDQELLFFVTPRILPG